MRKLKYERGILLPLKLTLCSFDWMAVVQNGSVETDEMVR